MLACALTVLQSTPRIVPTNRATSLGVSCLIASKWLMFPSWIASKVARPHQEIGVMPVDTSVKDVPPIVFISDNVDAIDQPLNVVKTNLNVEDDISTSYFSPSKKAKHFSTIDYNDDSVLFIHSSTQQTVLCLMIMYPLEKLSLLPIMQQISVKSSSTTMD